MKEDQKRDLPLSPLRVEEEKEVVVVKEAAARLEGR